VAATLGDVLRVDRPVAPPEIRLRAERRLGEILRETPKAPAGRPPKIPSKTEAIIPTLKDLGIDRKLSSRAQRFADLFTRSMISTFTLVIAGHQEALNAAPTHPRGLEG
jgi:hypothetical protein